jgi:hypothetical protein
MSSTATTITTAVTGGQGSERLTSVATSPEVQVFQAATVTIDQLVNAIKLAGACIIRNAVSPDSIDIIE